MLFSVISGFFFFQILFGKGLIPSWWIRETFISPVSGIARWLSPMSRVQDWQSGDLG